MNAPRAGTLRVGVIGCGNVAVGDHLPAYRSRPGTFRVAALADPTPERLEIARQALGLSTEDAHADPADLLARGDLDMVDLCTPNHLRAELAVKAARAGLHVLTEKPLATTPREGAAMVSAAREGGTRLGVMHNYLFFPEVIRTREVVAAGEIGPVEVAILNWLGVRDNSGTAAYRPTWRHDAAQAGGGVLMDMLHIVYLAEALLGRPIERVSAWVDARTAGASVEDVALARFEADGAAALVNVGWGDGPGGFAVSGPAGRVEVTYRDGGSGAFAPFERLVVHGRSGVQDVTDLPRSDPTGSILEDFAAAIRTGREPIASGEVALHILESTLAVYLSAALGRTVVLPLEEGSAVYERGVAGLSELELPDWSPIRRHGIFRVAAAERGAAS